MLGKYCPTELYPPHPILFLKSGTLIILIIKVYSWLLWISALVTGPACYGCISDPQRPLGYKVVPRLWQHAEMIRTFKRWPYGWKIGYGVTLQGDREAVSFLFLFLCFSAAVRWTALPDTLTTIALCRLPVQNAQEPGNHRPKPQAKINAFLLLSWSSQALLQQQKAD